MAKPWRIAIKSSVETTGAEVVCTLHYVTTAGTVTGDLGASVVAERVYDHLFPEFKNMCPTNLLIEEVTATEEVLNPKLEVPDSGSKSVEENGIISPGDGTLGPAICPLFNFKTNAAVRSGHGWMFGPPPFNKNALTANYKWDTLNDYYIAWTAFAALVDDEFDQSGTDSRHYTPVVYSKTRRRRGAENYWFKIESAHVKARPTYLRSRLTSP